MAEKFYFILEHQVPAEFISSIKNSYAYFDIFETEDHSWEKRTSAKILAFGRTQEKACRYYKENNKWSNYFLYELTTLPEENIVINDILRTLKVHRSFKLLGKVSENT